MLEPKNENETFFSREARATSVSGEARELKTSVAVFINDEDKDIFLLLLVFGFVCKTLELVVTIMFVTFLRLNYAKPRNQQ